MTATRLPLTLLSLLAVAVLAACGGGGGGGSSALPPAPPAPPPDSEPDAFTIAPMQDAVRGVGAESAPVIVQGINMPASVSITGGEYSVAGGAFTSAAGTVTAGQSIVVRVTAAAVPGGAVEATLSAGSQTAKFNVTTSSDVTEPTATVVFPTAQSRTSADNVIVRGTASDTESAVRSVRVNGVEATSTDGFKTWTARVPLAGGANTISVEAEDRPLNRSSPSQRAAITRNALLAIVEGLGFDTAGGRLLVADSTSAALLSIDLADGRRTIVANNSTPDTTAILPLRAPAAIAFEASGTGPLVLDRGENAIFRVDLTTGARTVVSSGTVPGTTTYAPSPLAMTLDAANGLVYVLRGTPAGDLQDRSRDRSANVGVGRTGARRQLCGHARARQGAQSRARGRAGAEQRP